MKRLFILLIAIMLSNVIFAQYPVTSTKSITSYLLNSIRDACHPDPMHNNYNDVMRSYWEDYIADYDEDCTDDMTDEIRNNFSTFKYSKDAFWGAIGHDANLHQSQNTANAILDLARMHLLDPDFPFTHPGESYLSLTDVFAFMNDPDPDTKFGRALSLAEILFNVSLMCDMLWFFEDGDYQEELSEVLDDLAWYTLNTVLNPSNYNNNSGYGWCGWSNSASIPHPGWSNGRLRLLSALGYAGCILDGVPGYGSNGNLLSVNADLYYNTATDQLFEQLSHPTPFTFDDSDGFIDGYLDVCIGDESSLYKEGLTYYSWSLDFLYPFFLAAKRIHNHNFFDNATIVDAVEEGLKLHGPDFAAITYNDSWKPSKYNRYMISERIFEFFYQNDSNPSIRENASWLFNAYRTANPSELPIYFFRKEAILLSYNQNRDITSMTSLPNFVSSGSYYENSEFTIIKPEINSNQEFIEKPAMYITHHNTYAPGHHDDDQTSFVMFYKGKNMIIDPGYKDKEPDDTIIGEEWLDSYYAHNLPLIQPDFVDERDNLIADGFWSGQQSGLRSIIRQPPYGEMLYHPQESSYPHFRNINPAHRAYLIKNESSVSTKIHMSYLIPEGYQYDTGWNEYFISYNEDLDRYFYFIDNKYYIIVDRLQNHSENNYSYRNQLHFSPYSIYNDPQILTINDYGSFHFFDSYPDPNNYPTTIDLNLFGVMGASNIFQAFVDSNLPMGWKKSSRATLHKRSRIEISSSNDDVLFLTLLIPSDNCTNPINQNIVNGNGYYGVRYDFDINDVYTTFTGVKSEAIGYLAYTDIPQVYVETNAEFFLVEANSEFDGYKKIILNGGNELKLQANILVFDSDHNFEEMLASYEDNELHVTFKTEQNDYPKYQIMRCGVEPENLYSKTEFGTYHHGTVPNTRGTIEDNILSLAFDEDYFYVNYGYSDYVTENLLTEDLTILQGTFDDIETSGVSVFGLGSITFNGKVTVSESSEIIFPADFNPTLTTNASFDVYGSVSAIGQLGNEILFDTDTNWNGFYVRDGGEVEFEYCKFENSTYPIRCLGSIIIKYCEVTNCSYGLYLQACDGYTIQNNSFNNCDSYGLLISNMNPFLHAYHAIWNNEIYQNQYGIYLFNTNVEIDSNYVHNNTDFGILASSGTSSEIENSCIQGTSDITDNPEIYLVDESYPLIDNKYNDITFDEGNSIYNADKVVTSYFCRNNYWGTTNQNDIGDSFHPSNWYVNYDPWLTNPVTGFSGGRESTFFELGFAAEEAGLIDIARAYYIQCINEGIEEIEKVWSASRLMNCIDEISFSYYDVQTLYDTIAVDTSNVVLSELAKKLAINCDRKNENFQEAIVKYENILCDSISFMDSILVQLNIVHTYFEAESTSGRASLSFQNTSNSIRDHKHAQQKEASLLNLLRQEILDEGQFTPVIDEVILQNNYPNPFNPTTTIKFSIPKESKVDLAIFNIRGQKVKTLVSNALEKGNHSVVWSGVDDSGKSVSSGVYFYKLNVNGKDRSVKKCLMLK